jgi:hypothetical protein
LYVSNSGERKVRYMPESLGLRCVCVGGGGSGDILWQTPLEKVRVCLSRSYRWILDEARIYKYTHKHTIP